MLEIHQCFNQAIEFIFDSILCQNKTSKLSFLLTLIHGWFRASWIVNLFLSDETKDPNKVTGVAQKHSLLSFVEIVIVIVLLRLLLLILLQQLADELLGQLTGVTEELLIKLIIYGWNVPQCVLFGLPQERWSTTQPGTKHKGRTVHHPV